MESIKNIVIVVLFGLLFLSCNKEEDVTAELDLPTYYDTDANCDDPIFINSTCCDVDGRILVVPNKMYSYTYKGSSSSSPNLKIEWTVLSGSIIIIAGQNTPVATFKFGSDFTTGKISATGIVNGGCCECQNWLDISKL